MTRNKKYEDPLDELSAIAPPAIDQKEAKRLANYAIIDALIELGVDKNRASMVAKAMVNNEIPHVTTTY